MVLQGMVALGTLLALTEVAAGGQASLGHRVSCVAVRFYVAKYSAPVAESWARSQGASEADIDAARLCLKGQPAQPMQAAVALSTQ
jgi:hypothetical protein